MSPNQISNIAPNQAPRQGVNAAFAIIRALLPTLAEKVSLAQIGNNSADITALQVRVAANEATVNELNANIASLQGRVTALENAA